ncbi:aldose epimerase family protein [Aquimarina spongiae]|uniref:Aldose 1-epimerase n=1 Tax=Aquimarina spongiae TaxID=570521 RepID=A0A1M6A2G1_9FLAO|nr:aldose epimerase family protein [Aquimarina spongiae]SHI30403.1 aldose 1-epimerase [Aquimarina spongiae]
MHIKKKIGYKNEKELLLFELSNDNNITVKITNYGATITSIVTPDCNGKLEEITCGFDNIETYFSENYLKHNPYFGATIGRCASRIDSGVFEIEGQKYRLPKNDRGNHLHGGWKGFDKKMWEATCREEDGQTYLVMKLQSSHMEEGYPGNVSVTVEFHLNNANELSILYHAGTDMVTPISLTNHTYFNLSGFAENVEHHQAIIYSDHLLELSDLGIANGTIVSLDQKDEDFRTGKAIGTTMKALEKGYDHYYLFDNNFELTKVASFFHPTSKRALDVSTTEPGMLFYTGYFISDQLSRENGDQYDKFKGFCCETHRYPNAPNLENTPKGITYPNAPYTSKTVFRFYVG